MREIKTAGQAIKELGGIHAVARIFGLSPKVVFNWRRRGLPPSTCQVLGARLRARHVAFNGGLFKQLVAVDGE